MHLRVDLASKNTDFNWIILNIDNFILNIKLKFFLKLKMIQTYNEYCNVIGLHICTHIHTVYMKL